MSFDVTDYELLAIERAFTNLDAKLCGIIAQYASDVVPIETWGEVQKIRQEFRAALDRVKV